MFGMYPMWPFYNQLPPEDFRPSRQSRRRRSRKDIPEMRRSPLKQYIEETKEIEEFLEWRSGKDKAADEKKQAKKDKEKPKPRTLTTLEAVLLVILLYPLIGQAMELLNKLPK